MITLVNKLFSFPDSFIPGKNKRKKLVADNHVAKKRKLDQKGNKTNKISQGDKNSQGKREFSKGNNDRTGTDKNPKKSKTEGKTPFAIMMERKKKKKKMVEKKKNKFKGKKKKV